MTSNSSSNSNKSQALISTLSQLENAIREWESTSEEIAKDLPSKEKPLTQAPQLAQSLLKRLREQIDDLSK
jgi:hypothetical protein